MSFQEARHLVDSQRQFALLCARYLAFFSDFNGPCPLPFRNLPDIKEHEFTTDMLVIILWFMSYTNQWTAESANDFNKHVARSRQLAKEKGISKLEYIDYEVSIDIVYIMTNGFDRALRVTEPLYEVPFNEPMKVQSGNEPMQLNGSSAKAFTTGKRTSRTNAVPSVTRTEARKISAQSSIFRVKHQSGFEAFQPDLVNGHGVEESKDFALDGKGQMTEDDSKAVFRVKANAPRQIDNKHNIAELNTQHSFASGANQFFRCIDNSIKPQSGFERIKRREKIGKPKRNCMLKRIEPCKVSFAHTNRFEAFADDESVR